VSHVAEIVHQLIQQGQWGAAKAIKPEESLEIMSEK
jgi:hypothetical protein